MISLFPDSMEMFSNAVDAVISQFKEPNAVYIAETLKKASGDVLKPVVLRGKDFGFGADASNINRLPAADHVSDVKMLSCSHLCLNSKTAPVVNSAEVSKQTIFLLEITGLTFVSPPLRNFFLLECR